MSEQRTIERIREAWLKDVGYILVADELCLDREFVRDLYRKWTKESMDEYGWGN